ncbi:unnamed protein product [Triticum turgidum subsp. durum]|uniref:F-box domain-containing protein n=1 Tax=Triticum turgidum subsp. durum TaxID=4567 RepID=A0A9R0SRK9_TRITD|nr:unnamed protein product [Triticum turgidum subsp. durum]
MPPGGGEASQHGRTGKEQSDPPEIRRRDDSRPAPPFPVVASQKRRQTQPASEVVSVPEGPLVEILARLPYPSLCRFKCVSKQWRVLCSDPSIVKRATQTLSGFFQYGPAGSLRFSNLSGGRPLVDASLPFLRPRYQRINIEQCSTSLLLCKCWKLESEKDKFDFIVCNPMTQQWTVLPPIEWLDQDNGEPESFELSYPFLVFDPSVPSRFVVFAPLWESIDVVPIYSWETGQWTPSRGWGHRRHGAVSAECVFLNGMIHFLHLLFHGTFITILDLEGEVCRKITCPDGMQGATTPGYGSVGCSQGLLHAWYMDPHDYQLSVWVLKDYYATEEEWTLKHTVDVPKLFEETESDQEEDYRRQEDGSCKYQMFAIHPEYNVIFITDWKLVSLSYDMDSGRVHPMCTSADFFGALPFIPCFADLAHG